jgi:hypothetical protein
MFNLKPITIEDKAVFKEYLSINQYENSEYNFTTWTAWQVVYQLKYAIIENCLCVLGENEGSEYAYFPLGTPENTKKALTVLMADFKERGKPFVLMSLSQKMLDLLKEFDMLDLFLQDNRRDFADYVYLREKLISLSGKKLHGKRNHFNYFENNFSYELLPITDENEGACRDKLKELIVERSLNPGEELNATNMVLKYRDLLNLESAALYVEGNLAGVILGECHHGTSIIHIAKSDVSYRGVAVALFKLFLESHQCHCTYVNFMEDLGIEGLRKAKLSYDPEYMIEKSILTLK